jgi:hypothetical protein
MRNAEIRKNANGYQKSNPKDFFIWGARRMLLFRKGFIEALFTLVKQVTLTQNNQKKTHRSKE